jgi:DNA-binding NarL/FixJ family response regulator
MNDYSILIVEDDEAQRLALHTALKLRGFRVQSAGDVKSARNLVHKLGQDLGVMVLDMRLEDREHPTITGADLGLEVRASRPNWPPEFLITSAFSEVDYYRVAVELGVAAYLHKEEHTQNQTIRHIRGLVLRRCLSVEQPNAAEQIGRIAESSSDRSEAVLKFCKGVLAPAFCYSLGAPFAILITVGGETQCCAEDSALPQRFEPAYKTLQGLIHGEANRTVPFVLDISKLRPVESTVARGIYERLNGGAFLPLSAGQDIRLSVGILEENKESREQLLEKPLELAKVLGQYLRPAVLEHLLNILCRWAELNARRREVLRATSRLCLHIGQEQLDLLSDAADLEKVPQGFHLQKMQALAEDLRDTGEILTSLGVDATETESEATKEARHLELVHMADLIRSAWETAVSQRLGHETALEADGDCTILAMRQDVFVVVSRLLQWLARRRFEVSADTTASIRVHCADTLDGPVVILEDRSRRLPAPLRRQLFIPFSQAVPLFTLEKEKGPGLHLPLYLAKMIVEMKYHGVLEDRSDEMEGDIGHRLVMRFPKAQADTI